MFQNIAFAFCYLKDKGALLSAFGVKMKCAKSLNIPSVNFSSLLQDQCKFLIDKKHKLYVKLRPCSLCIMLHTQIRLVSTIFFEFLQMFEMYSTMQIL